MSASREVTIQIVAALAAAGIIAWYASRKSSAPPTVLLDNLSKPATSSSYTVVDDGSPGGLNPLSVSYGSSGALPPGVVAGAGPNAQTVSSVLNAPIAFPNSGADAPPITYPVGGASGTW